MSVAVIGTVFMDCKAYAGKNYDPYGRNVGRITINHGGVGRNVAENIGRLGRAVTFFSGVDNSALAEAVIARLNECNVNTDHVLRGVGMGIWSVISDENGGQLGSVSQLPDTEQVEEFFSRIGEELIRSNDIVAVEVDYSLDVFLRTLDIAKKFDKKVYGVIANLDVANRVSDRLPELELMVCNDIEIGKLLDIDTKGLGTAELINALKPEMKRHGYRKLLVTAGAKGSVYIDIVNGVEIIEPAIETNVVDTAGAGDSFFSGVVGAIDKGCDMRKAITAGTRFAAETIGSYENTALPPENIFD